jgi:polyisoprenyl-phosphate glycosyltransferase
VLVAADLQDPPEMIGDLLAEWRQGAQVVWAVRRTRPGERAHQGFAAVYYWIMRRLVGLTAMPGRGADVFLIDRRVIDAMRSYPMRNTSILALITSLGFRQSFVEYDKAARAAGQSGWTLAKKVKLVVDSVTGFSDFPIRWCGYAGAALLLLSMVVALAGLLAGPGSTGFVLLAALLLMLTGIQLVALFVVGQYVWRALDASRGAPAYIVEAETESSTRT